MTPRQRAAAAGELTYLGGAMCKYGHAGPRYTSTGECLGCRKRPDATGSAPAPDPRLRDLTAKLHGVQTDIRQTAARLKTLLRKFDGEENPFKKAGMSGTIEREHNAWEALQRQAAGFELDIEAARPTPDPLRLAALLAAAGAPPTPPPASFELRFADASEIQANRLRLDSDPDQVHYRAQMARDKLVRDTTKAKLAEIYPEGKYTIEQHNEVLRQVKIGLGLAPLPAVEPDPATDEQVALVDRLTRVGGAS
jgi:hypothetical protein